jgi:hypothetical protein
MVNSDLDVYGAVFELFLEMAKRLGAGDAQLQRISNDLKESAKQKMKETHDTDNVLEDKIEFTIHKPFDPSHFGVSGNVVGVKKIKLAGGRIEKGYDLKIWLNCQTFGEAAWGVDHLERME